MSSTSAAYTDFSTSMKSLSLEVEDDLPDQNEYLTESYSSLSSSTCTICKEGTTDDGYTLRPFFSHDEETEALSESATPVNDSMNDGEVLDCRRVLLRLYLTAAATGFHDMPEWSGLASALQIYWGLEDYSLEFCEKYKSQLFWHAVVQEDNRREKFEGYNRR